MAQSRMLLLGAGLIAGATMLGIVGATGMFGLGGSLSPKDRSHTEVSGLEANGDSSQTGLSESARKYIWDIEQRAFQISYKGVPRLIAALTQRDREGLLEVFHAQFHGRIVSADSAERVAREFAEFSYFRAGDVSADREQFVDWLLGLCRPFRSFQAQLPLLYLSPVEPQRMDGAWQGTWILRLFGERAEGGPGEVVMRGKFVAEQLPPDLARDGGWISSWEVENAVIAHADRTLMEDVSAQCGIPIERLHDNWEKSRNKFVGTPGGVYACDFNNDGIVDLLITDTDFMALYAGRGQAKFEDVTIESGLPIEPPTLPIVAFADLDNDGDEDLILGNVIYENRGGYFVRRGQLPFRSAANAVAVADYDRDGLVDLYVSCVAPPPKRATARTSWVDDQSGVPNQLFRNLGNFQFADVTEQAHAAAGHRSTFTAVWLDADDDGWPDLYVINELGTNVLLHNEQNGTFTEHHIGPDPDGFAMGVSAGDVDGDGQIDVYIGNMYSKAGQRIIANIPPGSYPPELVKKMQGFVAGNLLLLNRPGLKFDVPSSAAVSGVGWAYGTAMVDLDGDGLLDLYATAGFASFSRKEPDG